MNDVQKLAEFIEKKRDKWIDISRQIWDFAETRFTEHRSSELLVNSLEEEGFTVERGVAEMPTSFIASFGTGKPVIAILGEYDALSNLSQKAGSTEVDPVEVGGNGHGCGHNLLGTGSLAAAVALKDYMEQEGISGTVKYYGCPAEEGGSGKTYMARAGVFADVDFALCWHPWTSNFILPSKSLANIQAFFRFKGKSAHAAAQPHLGRSALDAVELMNVGVNYLREHIIQEARVHYAVTNTGGLAPNVVQENAEVLYLIRAPQTSQVQDIYERVCDIARGAALMTGTQVEIVFDKACSNSIPNLTMSKKMWEVFNELGVPSYTEEELAFAKKLQSTLSPEAIQSDLNGLPKEVAKLVKDKPLSDVLIPYSESEIDKLLPGSTDVGDVSWLVPTAQIGTSCWVIGTPAHTWQVVSIGATSIGQKGMLQAAKVMAGTALEMLNNPELISKAKEELAERLDGQEYVCPIPADIKPGQNEKLN